MDVRRLAAIGAAAESGEPARGFGRESRNRGAVSQKRRPESRRPDRGPEAAVHSGSPSIVRGIEHTSAIDMRDQRVRNDA